MSMKNYNNYYKHQKQFESEARRAEIISEEEVISEEVIEEPIEEDTVVGEPIEEEIPEDKELSYIDMLKEKGISGVVTECVQLNVRLEPKADAPIVSVIPILTEVLIDEEKSTDDFYKVLIPGVNEGYCMKKYIAVQK